MGAGAVGCWYGGMLARAGHDVTLIGRAAHVDAVRRNGLWLDSAAFHARLPVQSSTDASAVADAQLVLFCVKSTDTESAADAIAPHLAPDARVLGLQNGVDNAERLQARLAQRVEPAVVYVAAEMAGPGHVRHHGRGELVIGPAKDFADIVAAFAAASVAVQVSDNVVGALWFKLVLNCAWNALSAIGGMPYGALALQPGVAEVLDDLVDEALAVAAAVHITLPGDIREAVQRIPTTMPGQRSSTAQDLARGRRTEIDHLNGHLVRLGDLLGVATPVNRAMHTLVKLREQAADPAAAD